MSSEDNILQQPVCLLFVMKIKILVQLKNLHFNLIHENMTLCVLNPSSFFNVYFIYSTPTSLENVESLVFSYIKLSLVTILIDFN